MELMQNITMIWTMAVITLYFELFTPFRWHERTI